MVEAYKEGDSWACRECDALYREEEEAEACCQEEPGLEDYNEEEKEE